MLSIMAPEGARVGDFGANGHVLSGSSAAARLCYIWSPDKPRPPRSQALPSSSQCLAAPSSYSRRLAARPDDLCKPGSSTVQSRWMALSHGRSSHQDPGPSARTADHLRWAPGTATAAATQLSCQAAHASVLQSPSLTASQRPALPASRLKPVCAQPWRKLLARTLTPGGHSTGWSLGLSQVRAHC